MDLREIQYVLPEGMAAAAAGELLSAHLALEGAHARSVDQRLYDTFDGRLHGAALTLTREGSGTARRLVLVDGSGSARSSAEWRSSSRRLFCSELPAGPLRDTLEEIVETRALTLTARIRSRLHPLNVIDDETKTVVRLVVQEAVLVGPGGAQTPLAPRLRVVPVRGYGEAGEEVRGVLEREVGLTESRLSLQDEAVRAAGGTPGGFSSKLDLGIEPGERADRATSTALAGLLATIEATLPGTLADGDTEFLHDLRVAVRRTRSLQRQLAPVFPPEPLAHFRQEFRELQQVTGALRDLDVHREELALYRGRVPEELARELEPLEDMLAARRRAELRRTVRALGSDRTQKLLASWSSFLEEFPGAPEHERPDAAERIAPVAARRIRAVYLRMVKMGRAVDDGSPPEALHDLRKKGKELRYMLEFFGGLYPAEVVKPMVRTLKGLQDVLGRHQDQEVQAGTLRSLREELGTQEGGPAALMAMGVLVEGLEQDHVAARGEFAERFAPFASKKQRKLVDATFR